MGVEPRHGEARPGKSELALQPFHRDPALEHDPLDAELLGHGPQRNMGGDRDDLQRRASQHHRDQVRRDPAALGDEFGLAGMDEADRVELRLGDRAGDDAAGGPGAGQADRKFQRVERIARALQIGLARHHVCVRLDAEDRKALLERADRIVRILDDDDRAVPDRTHRRDAADGQKRRDLLLAPPFPAFCDDFRPDPRRVAERNGERRCRPVSDSRSPHRAAGRAGNAASAWRPLPP